MKIAWLTHRDIKNPRAGGAEIAVHRLSLEQIAQGHEVSWFTSKFPGAEKTEVIDGIKVNRVSSENLLNWYLLVFFRKIMRPFDIVIESLCKVPFFWRGHKSQKVMAYTTHLFGKAIFDETNPLAGSYVYFLEKLIPFFYQKHLFAAISPSTKDDLISRGIPSSRIVVAPCGINLKVVPGILNAETRSKTPLIIYVGRLKKYKGLEYVLRSLPPIIKKTPEFQLMILGDGDDRSRLEEEARNLGIQNHVLFTGYVSEEEKIKWLQQAWVMVYPSVKEGQGLSILEAAVFQTPTIASHSPGLRDFILNGKTGLLVGHTQPETWATAIEETINNASLRQIMGKNAQEFCQQFSWRKSSETVMNVLQSKDQ